MHYPSLATTLEVPLFDEDGDITGYEEVEIIYLERCMTFKPDEIIITEINGAYKSHSDDLYDAIRDAFKNCDIEFPIINTFK